MNNTARHGQTFVTLCWRENKRRGGYFSSWAVGRRLTLWTVAWFIYPEDIAGYEV